MSARSAAWLWGAVLAGVSGLAWGSDAGSLRGDYLRSLERFEQTRGGSLERLFESGQAAASALREAGDAVPAPVTLPGFFIDTGEVRRADPDARFFLALARERGTAVDEEFFTLWRRTWTVDGVRRVYAVPLSDAAECHVFDHPELAPLYRDWTRLWATHPRAYTARVEREIQALEDVVARSTCACGERESVEAGLERFLKSFPRSPVAPEVRARLERVRTGGGDIHFRCQPG
ncbi:hypothetical protein [Pyxidicoccus xibeiensis]|uniref:hypothetical protein n=1 Tax=Pyxidicoccus xibeiensis TaxID=2906759 RepID=UPI0020A6F266|nr:hypothetical protein [Pyxidicoccus xibeiensis]MCP3139635.1 hypothetical protein [Pyxidicoccus xibeiensis]